MNYLSIRNLGLLFILVFVFSSCRAPKTKFDKDYPEYTDQKNTLAYYPVTKDSTTMLLSIKSTDKDYGRNPENPIFVGVTTVRDMGTYRMRFLNALELEDGTPVEYERVRTCCPFKTKNSRTVGPEQKYGLLDVWIAYPENQKEKADTLYFNPYDQGTPMIPTGYRSKKVKGQD
jgi:hypothetical protein